MSNEINSEWTYAFDVEDIEPEGTTLTITPDEEEKQRIVVVKKQKCITGVLT